MNIFNFDRYIDNNLNTSVYDKNIIIIKLDWKLIKINKNLFLWEIDIINNKNINIFIYLENFENNNDITINDILMINHSINHNLKIKRIIIQVFYHYLINYYIQYLPYLQIFKYYS